MKVVINNCYGGYGLSPFAVFELAKRKGKECYFFAHKYPGDKYIPISIDQADSEFVWFAFSVTNPNDYDLDTPDPDGRYKSANERAEKITLLHLGNDRSDPDLVAVVKQLGKKSFGKCAELKIITIPNDVKWHIEEYDGLEHIAEDHRIWQ